jgi:hypothetical protein
MRPVCPPRHETTMWLRFFGGRTGAGVEPTPRRGCAGLTAIRNTTRRRAGLLLLLALAKQRQARDLATVLERELRTKR